MVRVLVSDATRHWAHNLDDLRERWDMRREPPSAQEWMQVALFERECNTLNEEALQSLRAGILEVHHGILARLREFSANRRMRGRYADADIYNEVESARAATARHLVIVNDALGRRKHALLDERNQQFGARFILAAKAMLPKDTYKAIVAAARSGANLDELSEEKS